MKKIFILIICGFIFSCGKDKVIQLPEINHSDITELHDVSAAYLFYDETKKDSVEFNRKNLISTTNWLVNVDKRLTLKQAIPHIKFLQEKKANSSHKNESAKNYFTCNDTSRKNLGFIEFTDVVYNEVPYADFSDINDISIFSEIQAEFFSNDRIELSFGSDESIRKVSNKASFINDLKKIMKNETVDVELVLCFKKNLTFQEYISFKTLLLSLENASILILANEFIY
tara:strand:+ start:4562 stop:5245 length:684 start_codon:yes stop_codon:yes gene_type:complete